jgi:T6SS immunity protein Tdi1, C-terminal
MNLRDYLVDTAGKDWERLLAYWKPPLPAGFRLWLVNRLGEIIGTNEAGEVLRLEVGTARLERIAGSREEFARLIEVREHADAWLRVSLVDACREAGAQLGADECYGFRIPPPLLGRYEASNLVATRLDSHYSWLAHINRQDEIYWTGE